MVANRDILEYQQRCFRDYAQRVGLPEKYTYPDGNPIRPLPPIQTARRRLMIVGAYPSARFEYRKSHSVAGRYRLVPVADNLQPFANEQYFDGLRVRTLESGRGLRKYLLQHLGLKPKDCWITDLVKVFLYKPEHKSSCGEVFPNFDVPVLRSKFRALGEASLSCLEEECHLCKPKLIVTLGEEVAQVISGELKASAADLLSREITSYKGYPILYLPPDRLSLSKELPRTKKGIWDKRFAEGELFG
jgi:hypothetical protein